jgi:hypothetical protein
MRNYKNNASVCLSLLGLVGLLTTPARAEGVAPAVQAKIDAQLKEVQAWACDPIIIKAVAAHNTGLTPEATAMNEEKWKTLSVLDPFARSFSKNEAAEFLKSKQNAVVAKLFLSGADGTKVAYNAKTTNWSHKGMPKHEQPMSGKTWQGAMETDASTGLRMIQISAPVLDGGKPIGSLVVGLSISKLEP